MKTVIFSALLLALLAAATASAQTGRPFRPPGCACPDLRPVLVEGYDILATRTDADFLYFKVKNAGNKDAPASHAVFTYHLDNNQTQKITVPTPAVPAGATVELKVSPKFCSSTPSSGDCRWDVELDVRDTVKESDENNNYAEGGAEG